MGRQGQAITLLAPEDITKWRRLQRGFTRPITRAPWRGVKALLDGGTNGHGQTEDLSQTVPVAVATPTRERAHRSGRRPAAAPARQEPAARREPARRTPSTVIESEPELSGRELLQRYGRDPRRPTWADDGRQVASAAAVGQKLGASSATAPSLGLRHLRPDG